MCKETHTHTLTHLRTPAKAASMLCGHKVAITKISTHTHTHTHGGRQEETLPFTGEQEKETPGCFGYVERGESEKLWGGRMCAVWRLNLFHMTGLGLFLSTALLSSEESGSVTT